MRRLIARLVGCAALLLWAGLPVEAQTHKVTKPQTVVRAVGVYEWTGELGKPTGSRLVPVTVFIDGQLQDAGVYLARPVPFAILSGNLYELQEAGRPKGSLELSYAKHLQAVETATGASLFDDGWFGYGSFKAPAAEKKSPALRASTQLSEVKRSGAKDGKDDGRPHFSNKAGAPDASAADASAADASDGKTKADADSSDAGSKSAPDADRPTMRRRSGSSGDDASAKGSAGSQTGSQAGSRGASSAGADTSTPSDDPDRPHLSKKKDSAADDVPGDPSDAAQSGSSGTRTAGSGTTGSDKTGSDKTGAGTTSTPTTASGGSKDDPDRPTLKRRTADEIKKDRKKEDSASVTGIGSLNDDPNRPTIRRGKPASAMTEDDLPKLSGLPVDLKQMVAVSDPATRPEHDFARPWEDDAERKAILTKMQALARTKLAAYGVTAAKDAAAAPAPAAKVPATPAARRAAAPTAAVAAKKKATAKTAEVALLDEDLKGYTLSYGGLATYVYSAHTAGTGAALDYVTVVAQADALGELKVAMDSTTDAAHLDRTPRMRLVDVVDVEASNRASLLFELRGQRSRQFGLYSVIGARADQKFLSGTTQ